MTRALLPAPTVAQVLHQTLPAMQHLASPDTAITLRHRAYALAYDRRLMREVDADRRTLDRPASASLVCLSSRLIDLSLALKVAAVTFGHDHDPDCPAVDGFGCRCCEGPRPA